MKFDKDQTAEQALMPSLEDRCRQLSDLLNIIAGRKNN